MEVCSRQLRFSAQFGFNALVYVIVPLPLPELVSHKTESYIVKFRLKRRMRGPQIHRMWVPAVSSLRPKVAASVQKSARLSDDPDAFNQYLTKESHRSISLAFERLLLFIEMFMTRMLFVYK